MLRCAVAKIAPATARQAAAVSRAYAPAAQIAVRTFASPTPPPAAPAAAAPAGKKLEPWEEEGVVLAEVVDSLEWTLSSPPPVHQFDEPPIMVEIAEA